MTTNEEKRKLVEKFSNLSKEKNIVIFINTHGTVGVGLLNELMKIKSSVRMSGIHMSLSDFDIMDAEKLPSTIIFEDFHKSNIDIQNQTIKEYAEGKLQNKTLVLVGDGREIKLDSVLTNKFIIIE